MKTPQFEHQKIGTAALVKHPAFALFDEMGAGKSKQVIDAACALAQQGKIDIVIVVAPASVRCVWADAKIGEIKKHSWVNNHVFEFHRKTKIVWGECVSEKAPEIIWTITNYEFLRNDERLLNLCATIEKRKTLLVLDESSYIKNRSAKQTKAIAKLRQHCARCVLLNGTPVTNSPLDLWSQMQILSPKILKEFKGNFYFFKYEYCNIVQQSFGGHRFQQVVSYKNLDKLAKKVAPYVLRREKKDCLDLPEKLYTVREVALTPESWKRYKELKRDFLVSLGPDNKQIEPNAAVRIMRLAQLTSGILGGGTNLCAAGEENEDLGIATDISSEKLSWCVKYLTEECTAKAVIFWCRWRRERERLATELRTEHEKVDIVEIYGGQNKSERETAVQLFSTALPNDKRLVMVAQQRAGGYGLNLVAATEANYLSNDFSLVLRLQSEDRCHRPGQRHNVLYNDVLATGPQGQHTVDHVIYKALQAKQEISKLTCAEWRRELEDE